MRGLRDVFGGGSATKTKAKNNKKNKNQKESKRSETLSVSNLEREGINLDVIEEIHPRTYVEIHNDYIKSARGNTASIQIVDFPKPETGGAPILWMQNLVNFDECVVKLSTIPKNTKEGLKEAERTIREQKSRIETERKEMDAEKAAQKVREARAAHEEFNKADIALKNIGVEIRVSDVTRQGLDDRIRDYIDFLETRGGNFSADVIPLQAKENMRTLFLPPEYMNAKHNLHTVTNANIALGLPFNANGLLDPFGSFIGTSESGNPVVLDRFRVTKDRLAFNSLILGSMGSGKSELIKNMLLASFARRNFIRGFSKNNEYNNFVRCLGGEMINLFSRGNLVNPFQIFSDITSMGNTGEKLDAADPDLETKIEAQIKEFIDGEVGKEYDLSDLSITNEELYDAHLQKLNEMFGILIGDLTNSESNLLDMLFRAFYNSGKLLRSTIALDQHPADAYPTLSDFILFVDQNAMKSNNIVKYLGRENRSWYENYHTDFKPSLMKIQLAMLKIRNAYGYLFDGHSTDSLDYNKQVVMYDISGMEQIKDKTVQVAQLYSALKQIQGEAVQRGRKQKEAYERNEIDVKDFRYTEIVIDECHNIINPNYGFAVNLITTGQRELRKFSAGYLLSTQSMTSMIPVSKEGIDGAVLSDLFRVMAFSEYKFTFQLNEIKAMDDIKAFMGHKVPERWYAQLPQLGKGNCILSINGHFPMKVHTFYDPGHKEMFGGGL